MAEQNDKPDSTAEFSLAVELAVAKHEIESVRHSFERYEARQTDAIQSLLVKMDEVRTDLAKWPLRMQQCKDQVDDDIKVHMAKYYATLAKVELLEQRILERIDVSKINTETEIRMLTNRFTWTVGGFVTAGVFLAWLLEVLPGGS